MNRLRQNVFLLFVLFLLFLLSSCDSKRYFEENKTLENGVWKADNKLQFMVPVSDTLGRYDFFLNVRNDGNYPFSNLYFFIRTTTPKGTIARDTVECRLADDYGKWLGTGMGSVKFNRFFFRENMPLRELGNYIFEFEHAMRTPELKGIRDIGLRIEKR
jgi:gliding motility-associated lipoprotein GldH